jgi:hypothetical protein
MTNEDHKVRFLSFKPRPEKCCEGAAVTVSPAFDVRFPPVELDDALRFYAPRFEVRADPERGHEWHFALGELADGRVVEVVVVVVRHDHEIDGRHRAKGDGYGLETLGTDEP